MNLVDRCLSFCPCSFDHCVVCSSSKYGFWLHICYLQTLFHITVFMSHDPNGCVMYCYYLASIQWSTKQYTKTKDRVTWTSPKTGGELMCSGRVSSSYSTSATPLVNLVTKPVRSHEWGEDREVFSIETSVSGVNLPKTQLIDFIVWWN
jgi:hypothetical protein